MKKNREKSAQSAIEFFILVGFAFFFFVSFVFLLEANITQKNSEKIDKDVREIALIVQDEIALAHSASDGYSRNFILPAGIMWANYTAQIISNSVYVVTDDGKHAISLGVFNVSGQPRQGTNTIRNVQRIVYLNS
jgi:hypothetical protein